MAKQSIGIGSSANDGTGDPLRTAFDKINDNFDELYGATAEANDLIEDASPQLGGDLDVNGRRITSARSNEDIVLLPNGTGGVIASALRFAGTTISSDDSSSVNINEGLIVDGTASVSGAVSMASTLAVTGVATFTATPVFSSDITLTDDLSFISDGAVVNFGANSEIQLTHVHNVGLLLTETGGGAPTLTFRDSALSISSSADGQLDIAADTEVQIATTLVDLNGNLDVSGTALITGVATFTATPIFSSDVTVTDDINLISDSAVVTFGADSEVSLTHTNDVGLTLNSTNKLMFNDASQFIQGISATVLGLGATAEIDLTATAIDINGTCDISGTLTTAAVTASGTATFNGAVVINGATAIGDLNILADGTITTDSNGDFVVDPAGTGAIVLTGPITATGVQTTTGQLNVDNLRMDGNTLSATSGAITLTPAAGQNVIVGGTNTNLTGTEANFTLMEATTVRANFLQSDTTNADLDITTQGTGVVKLDDETQLTLTGSFLPALHTFVATDAVTIVEHAGRTLLLGEVGGNAALTLTLPAATGTGAVYKFIVSVTNTSNYKIQVADATDTIDGVMMYLDVDGTAVTAFPTVAASDTITLNGTTQGGIIGDYLELIDIATNQYHVRGVMRVPAGSNPATPFSAAVS
jgi:hypothetical protein